MSTICFEGGGLFTGGLTFDPGHGLFYVLSSDGLGVSRLFSSIALDGTVTQLFNLGDGSVSFHGGLLFDPSGGQFFAISNDNLGNSTLDTFTLSGAGAFTPLFSIGQGLQQYRSGRDPRDTRAFLRSACGPGAADRYADDTPKLACFSPLGFRTPESYTGRP